MNSTLKGYMSKFDAQSPRERGLIALTLIVSLGLIWWSYFAQPRLMQIDVVQQENQRIGREVDSTRAVVAEMRRRIAAGIDNEKELQLVKLNRQLVILEDQLRVKTIELIDPEKMFQLMNQLIYSDSRLKLLSLKRLEVKPAIPITDDQPQDQGIYRHVLEIQFSGKFLDILRYMQSLEHLDWKLLWDEIEIISEEYPRTRVKVVISTLSTRKEWVGI